MDWIADIEAMIGLRFVLFGDSWLGRVEDQMEKDSMYVGHLEYC